MTPLPSPVPTRRAVARRSRLTLASAGRSVPAVRPDAAAAEPGVRTWRARPAMRSTEAGAVAERRLWAFDGDDAGGVLRLRRGCGTAARLHNETPQPLSLHWHGVRGPNAMDGVGGLTQEPVAPGRQLRVPFTPPEPGTFLIRPCVLGGSAEPAERGLCAVLVVEEDDAAAVDHEFVLLVDDWLLAEDGALAPFGGPDRGGAAGSATG